MPRLDFKTYCAVRTPICRLGYGQVIKPCFRRLQHRTYYRASNLFFTNHRDNKVNEPYTDSHALLVQAGYIRQTAAGVFTLLHPAYRVLSKIQAIIADELNRIGCSQVALPCLHPSQLWEQSGRWQTGGPELFRLKDRHETDYCLGPTHEEVVTHLVASELTSYRQLPIKIYQMDRKFRDEARPRRGLLRGREFWMKDLYTFDENEEAAQNTYDSVCAAYGKILERLALRSVRAQADTGNIGGKVSHEFHVISKLGEDKLVHCMNCGYAANLEKAQSSLSSESAGEAQEWFVGNTGTDQIAAVLPKGYTINLTKLEVIIPGGLTNLRPVSGDEWSDLQHTVQKIIFDSSLSSVSEYVRRPCTMLGDGPVIEIVYNRTLETKGHRADIRNVEEGDHCTSCRNPLRIDTAIEVGHAFNLGQKYSKRFNCRFNTRDAQLRFAEMGCYGLGLTRILASIVENHHDKNGLVWPVQVAPFRLAVVPIFNFSEEDGQTEMSRAVDLCDSLTHQFPDLASEIVLEDRRWMTMGARLKNVMRYGFPYVAILGPRTNKSNMVELESRYDGSKHMVSYEQLSQILTQNRLGEHKFEPSF